MLQQQHILYTFLHHYININKARCLNITRKAIVLDSTRLASSTIPKHLEIQVLIQYDAISNPSPHRAVIMALNMRIARSYIRKSHWERFDTPFLLHELHVLPIQQWFSNSSVKSLIRNGREALVVSNENVHAFKLQLAFVRWGLSNSHFISTYFRCLKYSLSSPSRHSIVDSGWCPSVIIKTCLFSDKQKLLFISFVIVV